MLGQLSWCVVIAYYAESPGFNPRADNNGKYDYRLVESNGKPPLVNLSRTASQIEPFGTGKSRTLVEKSEKADVCERLPKSESDMAPEEEYILISRRYKNVAGMRRSRFHSDNAAIESVCVKRTWHTSL